MTQRHHDTRSISSLTLLPAASDRRVLVRMLGAIGLALFTPLGRAETAAKHRNDHPGDGRHKNSTRRRRGRASRRRTESGRQGPEEAPALSPAPGAGTPARPPDQIIITDPPSAFDPPPDGDTPEQDEHEQVSCGSTLCAQGEVCCNASCGICTAPGEACVDRYCE